MIKISNELLCHFLNLLSNSLFPQFRKSFTATYHKKSWKKKIASALSTLRRNFIFREIYLQAKCAEKTCSVCFWSVIMIQQNFYFCTNAKRLFCLRLYQKKKA